MHMFISVFCVACMHMVTFMWINCTIKKNTTKHVHIRRDPLTINICLQLLTYCLRNINL